MKLVKNENEKKINEVTDKEAEEAFVKIPVSYTHLTLPTICSV